MKVTILFPENPNKGGFPLAPPVLEYLAALTLRHRPDCEVELIDANRTKVDPDALATDLLGISLMTPSAPWGYRFADRVRARGIPVVLGGIHPTALPDEARAHADAVVVGEAESVWGQVLDDAERKGLRGLYHGARLPLDDMPTPAVGTLRGHYPFRGVFTSRGCIHKCSFCSVRKFFGDTVRYRPIADVARIPGRIYYNGDDNIWGHHHEVLRLIDTLGGFLARKADGEPDAKTMLGFQRVNDTAASMQALRQKSGTSCA